MTTHESEADFHDRWAGEVQIESIDVFAVFEAITALENRFILSEMGDIANKTILDIGTGLGESATYFAIKGAHVTTVDVSTQMLAVANQLAHRHGVSFSKVVGSIEQYEPPPAAFDIVYAANVLHHTQDRDLFFKKILGALKPGGRFYLIDPLAYNPVINVYRKMADQVRTSDERPLTRKDIERARKYFPNIHHREFWIASLVLFAKYFCIDRIHPNADRYWKRILCETRKSLWWLTPFILMDAVFTRLPGVRFWAWNIVIWGEKTDYS